MNLKPLIPYLITIALTALVTYLLCRPSNDVLPTIPTKEIVQQTEDKAQPQEKKIDSLTKIYEKSRDSITVLKFKWQSAVAENNRLREMRAPSHRMHIDFIEPTNGTAEDYISELQQAAANSDTSCANLLATMERREAITDSLYQSQKAIAEIFRQGFNNLAQQSQLKDAAIKSLNKQLKWQKVQATGLKVAALVVAAVVIKNQLK